MVKRRTINFIPYIYISYLRFNIFIFVSDTKDRNSGNFVDNYPLDYSL